MDEFARYGFAGVVIYLVFDKLVTPLLSGKTEGKRNGAAGDKDPAFWSEEIRMIIASQLNLVVIPQLSEIRREVERIRDRLDSLVERR